MRKMKFLLPIAASLLALSACPKKESFEITWMNRDNSVLYVSKDVKKGEMPEYKGETPTYVEPGGPNYKFVGWDPEVVPAVANATYVAKYETESVNNYTVTWKNYNGEVLELDENVPEGTMPEYNGATPTRPDTATQTYTFNKWLPEPAPITKDTTYTASFTRSTNKSKIKTYIHDAKGNLASAVEEKDSTGNYVAVTTTGTEVGIPYYMVTYGAEVRIPVKNNGYFEVTGATVDGNIKEVNDGYIYFKAEVDDPSDEDMFFIDVTLTYNDTTPIVGDYRLIINNTTHLTATAYREDKKTEANGANANDIINVFVSSDDKDIFCRKLTVKVVTDDMGHTSETVATDLGDGWFSFKTPYAKYNEVAINLEEGNSAFLKDTGTVGEYFTFWITSSKGPLAFSSKEAEIKGDGTIILGGDENAVNQVDETKLTYLRPGADSPTITIYYGNNMAFIGDGITTSPFGSYDNLCLKKVDPKEDKQADYSVDSEAFVIEGNKYVVASISYKGEHYASAFLDYAHKKAYFGVTFERIANTSSALADDATIYRIKTSGGETLLTVGYNGNGGINSRCLLNGAVSYENEDKTLLLHGTVNCTYDGQEMNYSYDDEDTVKLIKGGRTIVIDIDNETATYTVVSDETVELVLPEFAGKAYRQNFAFDDGAYLGMYIEFSATDLTFSCVIAADYNLDLDHCSTQQRLRNIDVPYTYNEKNHAITATMQVVGGATATVIMQYASGVIRVPSKAIGNGTFNNVTAQLNEIL